MLLRMSTLFLRTLRDDPADAEVPSHRLLVRGGYIRRVAPGIYSWLPLGMAVLANIERVVREEMASIGSQEVHFPALIPREIFEASGRWADYGDSLEFQGVADYRAPDWPGQERPQQMHIDVVVEDLDAAEAAVLELGATKHEHQPGTTFRVFLDPAGHPFCLCSE